ncbi:MAG: DMT family transporter [Desulfatiglandaceae bacterium]
MFFRSIVFWAYLATFLGVFGHATSEFFSVLSGLRGPEVSVWRYTVGAASLLIVCLSGRNSRNLLQPIREQPFRLLALSVFGLGFAQLVFHWSLDYASIIQVATIVTTMPILVVIVDRIINKSRITTPKIVSGIGAFIGVVLLLTDGYLEQLEMGGGAIYGVLLALICAIVGSVYLVLIRPVINQYGAIRITTLSFVFGAVALWITVGFAWDIWVDPTTLFERPSQAYLSILTLGIWNTCIGFILWLWGLSAAPDIGRANYLFFLKPVIAATLAFFILNMNISAFQLLAILMICGCVLVEVFYDQISGWLYLLRGK